MEKKKAKGDGKAIVLDKSIVEKLDLSKVPLGAREESTEVSAQSYYGWITSPCNGEQWHFSGLHCGYNLLRDATGCVWTEHVYNC